MPNHKDIYQNKADQYEQMVSKQPKLLDEIQKIRPTEGLDIVDIGAGSGRLTSELAPTAKSIIALDASEAMLQITADKLTNLGLDNWQIVIANLLKLPLEEDSADLIVAGWSICYTTNSDVPEWKDNIQQMVREIKRVLRPGGTVVIFETMGTGTEEPNPPSFLTPYYSVLEQECGFSFKWIRMDYEFHSVEEAEQLTRSFFGDDIANFIVQGNHTKLPECAGVWWLHKELQ